MVFAAEEWPECLNPITGCALSPWTWYTVLEHVLPRAMQLDQQGNMVASLLLVEAPTLSNGGLTESPFTVRYRISDEAVWDDSTPITSADFAFTWRAILSTPGAIDRDAYDRITGIDTSDPNTVVISFEDVFVGWPNLFGGANGFVLEQAAFPDVEGDASPDLSDSMQDRIPFSGGPFRLTSWDRSKAVLERNDRYVGGRAFFDQVTFLSLPDRCVELMSLYADDVQVMTVDPAGFACGEMSGSPGIQAVGGDTTRFLAMWLRIDVPPFDDALVRQALMFAIDRQRLVDSQVKLGNPNATVLNCGLGTLPKLGPWCLTEPFASFSYDPDRSRSLLEEAGYNCSATICTKGGKKLVVTFTTDSSSLLRTTAQQLILDRAKDAGFELRPRNWAYSCFGCEAPCLPNGEGAGPLALCESRAAAIPTMTDLLPGSFAGETVPPFICATDIMGWCQPDVPRLLNEADRTLDIDRRASLLDQVFQLEADDAVALPLFAVPTATAWNSSRIAGPIGDWTGSLYGAFFNMNEWYLAP